MQADLTLARRHVELLTGDPDTPCCFRLIDDVLLPPDAEGKRKRRNRPARNLTGTLVDIWPTVEAWQRDGYGVFIVVNEGGQRTEDITRVRALFIDCDDHPTPDRWHIQPDFIIRHDENHWHAYWLVSDCKLEDFSEAQRRLAAYYKTDPNVHDLPRVMRLAGTLHLKAY